jgi:hypothetical protein
LTRRVDFDGSAPVVKPLSLDNGRCGALRKKMAAAHSMRMTSAAVNLSAHQFNIRAK